MRPSVGEFASISVVGRPLTWLLTAPLLLAGLVGGHSLGYRLAVADPHERARALQESGHGYWAYVPPALALCLTLVLAALALRSYAAFRGRSRGPAPPWAFALLPPLAFVLQEHLERLLVGGEVWAVAAEPCFLLGLAVQLPLALAALLLARLLESAAEAAGRALAGRPAGPRARPPVRAPLPPAPSVARIRVAALAYGVRGPPCFSS